LHRKTFIACGYVKVYQKIPGIGEVSKNGFIQECEDQNRYIKLVPGIAQRFAVFTSIFCCMKRPQTLPFTAVNSLAEAHIKNEKPRKN
jgi:hypothetical protein